MHLLTRSARAAQICATFSAALFFLGLIFGYAESHLVSRLVRAPLRQLIQTISHTPHTWGQLFFALFTHNAASAAELVMFGFLFGVFPAYMMWTNGVVIGYVVHVVSMASHIAPWRIVAFGLLPHGVFELFAILWAGAIGIHNGLSIAQWTRRQFVRWRSRRRPSSFIIDARSATLRPVYSAALGSASRLAIIWGILLIAAFVESTITPELLRWGIPALHHLEH